MKKITIVKQLTVILLLIMVLISCGKTKRDWENAKQINSIEAYETFLNSHPSGEYFKEAKSKIDSCNYYMWPPKKIISVPTNFIVTSSFSFHEWKNVNYEGEERMAFIIKDAKIILPENIFSISKPTDGFAEIQIGVVYYDDKQTFVEVDSTKKDELDMIYLGPGQFQTTHILPGTHIRYQDKLYELRKDGWYLKNIKIHEFADE